MTDDEAEETSIIYLLGFAKGREFERKLIVAWLQANLKGNVDPWSSAADAIKAGEHLK